MKIQILTQYYTPYLNSFYVAHPKFKELSYKEMLNLLLNQFFADTGAAHYYFNLNGYESSIIIANCELLQKKWAQENNFIYDHLNWEKEIALAQIQYFKPDVFYIESIFSFYGAFIKEAKKYSKKIAAWISTPYTDDLPLNDIDVIFSSTPDFVKCFNKLGISSYYILPGFDERVIDKIKNPQPKTINFSFVGGWSDVHINRKLLLNQFVSKTPLEIWGYGYKKNYSIKSLSFYKNYFFPDNKEILKHYHKELWGLEMYEILQKSLITLNVHEALLNGNVGNMRMFEATGVGTMLLNDYGNNLSQLFEIDKEIVAFKSFPEALEKYQYYVEHPTEAIQIGLNAQKRTLRDYTFNNHVLNISDKLKKIF